MESNNQDSIQQNKVNMDDKNDRKVGFYVVGFVILLGVLIGILVSYMTNITPKKTETKEATIQQKEEDIKDISQITENLKKEPEKKVIEAAQVATYEKNNQASSQNNQTVITNKIESNQKNENQQNLSLQDQIQKLKEMLKNRELKIAELEKKLSESTKETLKKLPKISSIVVGECVNYEIGSYLMPKECKDAILKRVKEVKKEPNIIVWEIIPRVDTRAYKGDLPELKQSGLGSYRANSVKLLLKEELGNNELILQSWILQEEDKRGFVLKVYKLETLK